MKKERLDKLLVNRGLVSSRERANILITDGNVIVAGKKVFKGGIKVEIDEEIELLENDIKWVSKGGAKLEKAFETWSINPDGWVCIDIGASTGGFTDVLLTFGAKRIYAVDVGHNQLAEKLKSDIRVINFEKINAREIEKNLIPEKVDFICIDVSFISLELVIPEAIKFLKQKGEVILLIKPQFHYLLQNH